MVTVKLYVEGAGQSDLERTQCRQAFSELFKAAGISRRPRTVPCGGRAQAYDAFATAVSTAGPDDLPLLLVDSETPVASGATAWQHLKARDKWDVPAGAGNDQAYLMVQVMETWFIADRELLRGYFGAGFAGQHIKQWPGVEDVPKQIVYDALEKATAGCTQKAYCKGRISFDLLAKLDPNKLEAACPHARELLERLRKL